MRQADATSPADNANVATKAPPPLVKRSACADHAGGKIKSATKKTTHAQEVSKAPLKFHLQAATKKTNRYSSRNRLWGPPVAITTSEMMSVSVA
jgi:hypothetical protein